MAWITNAQHIDLKRSQPIGNKGNYDTLHNLIQKREVSRGILIDTDLTVTASDAVLVDSTMVAWSLAVWLSTTQDNGGVFVSALPVAVWTWAGVFDTDSYGNILNMVEVVDAVTRDPIFVNERKVYGLLQCSNTAVDWDIIGGTGAENVQISFVTMWEGWALAVVSITADIDFAVNKVYALKNDASIKMSWGFKWKPDIIMPNSIEPKVRKYEVTTAFVANEVIGLSTGAGWTAWVTTVTWDTINTLGASGVEFESNNNRVITLIGVGPVTKEVYAIRDTATTFHFTDPLSVWDRFEVQVESNN